MRHIAIGTTAFVRDKMLRLQRERRREVLRERDMRPMIDDWLRDRDFVPAHECLLSAYVEYVDVLGIRFCPRVGRAIPELDMLVAVELKLNDIAGVLRQSRSNRHYVHFAYAAMPEDRCKRMREKTRDKFRVAGIGLLAIGEEVSETIPARFNDLKVGDYRRKQHWRRYRRAVAEE